MQLVVPALNEAERIGPMLDALRRFVRKERAGLGFEPVEVIVVDNGSEDATVLVALAHSTPDLPVSVIPCPVRGKGAAVRTGLLATTHDVVGFLDADGATDLEALVRGAELIRLGHDVVVGSRVVDGSAVSARETVTRCWGSRLFRFLTRKVVPGIEDTQCGFKLFRGEVARTLFARQTMNGFAFDVEVLALAAAHELSTHEMPVRWTDVAGSTFSTWRHGPEAFASLARIAWTTRGARRATVRHPVVAVRSNQRLAA